MLSCCVFVFIFISTFCFYDRSVISALLLPFNCVAAFYCSFLVGFRQQVCRPPPQTLTHTFIYATQPCTLNSTADRHRPATVMGMTCSTSLSQQQQQQRDVFRAFLQNSVECGTGIRDHDSWQSSPLCLAVSISNLH